MTQLSIGQLNGDIDIQPDGPASALQTPDPTARVCGFSTRKDIADIWSPKVKCLNPARYIISDTQNRDKKLQVIQEQALGRHLDDTEKAALPHSHHLAICEPCWANRAKISAFDLLEDLAAVQA